MLTRSKRSYAQADARKSRHSGDVDSTYVLSLSFGFGRLERIDRVRRIRSIRAMHFVTMLHAATVGLK
eukprot:5001000-Pleurochrysis_carterae.AAC.1